MSLDFLLTYVEARGRAEPINLLLIDANVNFYDERIPIEEWQTRKKEGKYGPVYGQPFHGLPTLEVQTLMGPFKLAGTYAILDYLDDAFDTHEGRDMLQKGKINMVRDVSMSFLLDFHELLRNETWDDPEEHAAVHKSRILPFLLDLSRHISMNGLRKTFGADPDTPLTAAGACAFEALDLIELLFPTTLAEWPILAILRQRIASRPRIRSYLESGKRCQQITMSPFETFDRIEVARAHPLVFERKRRDDTVLPPTTPREPQSFERKKKGRQPSRPSTVAGDGKGKGFEKVTSWVESNALEPGMNTRNYGPMVDPVQDSRPPTMVIDGTLSDPEGGRTRSRSISGFFKRDSKRSTKVPKVPKEPKGKDSKESKRDTRRSTKRDKSIADAEIKSLRSVRSEVTLDITRASRPTTPAPEPPLPMTAAQRFRMKVDMPPGSGKGKRVSLSDSEYSPDSDVPDEIKPRAL